MLVSRNTRNHLFCLVFILILKCWVSSTLSIASETKSKQDLMSLSVAPSAAHDSDQESPVLSIPAQPPSRSFVETLRAFERNAHLGPEFFNWLPSDIGNNEAQQFNGTSFYLKLIEILMHMRSESSRISDPILNSAHDHRDFGYTFNRLIHFQRECLADVKARYEAANFQRIQVMDIGAGFGTMTWKLILAGGKTVAVEPQEPTMSHLKKRLQATRSTFFRRGEKLSDVSLAAPMPILSQIPRAEAADIPPELFYAKTFKNHFEVIWLGNLLHFMNPVQAQTLAKLLFDISQPGARVFALMDSIIVSNSFDTSTKGEVRQTFLEETAKGNPFPGYFAMNIEQIRNGRTRMQCTQVTPLPFDEEGSIGTVYAGNYAKIPEKTRIRKGDAQFERASDIGSKRMGYYQVYQLFDADTLTRLFQNAGFVVEDVYYVTADDRIVRFASPEAMSIHPPEDLKITIRARKP